MSDPNQVYELEGRLFKFGYLDKGEIDRFASIYFHGRVSSADRPKLEGLVRQAVARLETDDDEGRKEEFRQLLKKVLGAFMRSSLRSSVWKTRRLRSSRLMAHGWYACCQIVKCPQRSRSQRRC